jgi:curved DNA-binding protein CbpA
VKDLYAILGLQPNATQAQIREKYRFLAKSFHPDTNRDPAATRAMEEVNAAYEVLGDREKRRAYDLERKVKAFTPKVEGGTVDILGLLGGLVAGKVPEGLVKNLSPIVERALEDRGISARAATPEQILSACGLLKKRRKRSA